MLPESPDDFLVQIKYDGWNVVVNEGHVYTRHGNDITSWTDEWLFDLHPPYPVNGELVVVDGKRKDIPSIKTGKFRPRIWAFDVMVEDMPLEERYKRVWDLLDGELIPAVTWDGKDLQKSWSSVNKLFEHVKERGHDGLVLKKKGSLYQVSDEISVVTPDWLRLLVPVDERQGAGINPGRALLDGYDAKKTTLQIRDHDHHGRGRLRRH